MFPLEASLTKAMIGFAVQLSLASVTTEISAAGISSKHWTFTATGFEAVGFVVSLIVIVWIIFIEFPASSVTE